MKRPNDLSQAVVARLPLYYRIIKKLRKEGIQQISSKELAKLMKISPSQVRLDFNLFGSFGRQNVGYDVENIYNFLREVLGLNRNCPAVMLGAGKIGQAMLNNIDFNQSGFEIIGVFDCDPQKIGKIIANYEIYDAKGVDAFCLKYHPKAFFICLPNDRVEKYIPLMEATEVQGIWNFSSAPIELNKKGIIIENVHLGDSLMRLSCNINLKEENS